MKEQQKFMKETQRENMERQMAMQQLMQQRQMAMQLARTREMFYWVASFAGTVGLVLVAGAMKTGNPRLLGPLLPLGFGVGYQYDLVVGNKLKRIRDDAEFLIREQNSSTTGQLRLPNGPLTFDEVEEKRAAR